MPTRQLKQGTQLALPYKVPSHTLNNIRAVWPPGVGTSNPTTSEISQTRGIFQMPIGQ